MAYKMFLDGVLMPITPSKVTVKIKNQNKTMTLINGEEINFLKDAGLTDISFELMFPQVSYPFTNGEAKSASYYLSHLEKLKSSKEPFQWILNRSRPNGAALFHTNLKVGMENYEIVDDAKNGFDLTVKVNLKQYRPFGTKTVTIKPAPKPADPPKATVAPAPRPATTAPKVTTHTVVRGDCLWNIAKKYLGNGAKYDSIYQANKDLIDRRNRGTGLSKYTIYAGQVLTIPN